MWVQYPEIIHVYIPSSYWGTPMAIETSIWGQKNPGHLSPEPQHLIRDSRCCHNFLIWGNTLW